jgi:hypothetical protein
MTLNDLLCPKFVIILGTILLACAIIVLYFERKSKEQNHKINSMLSLVSTLAEDLNNYKVGLNNLSMMVVNNQSPNVGSGLSMNGGDSNENSNKNGNENDLINVSDDDNECDDDDDDDDEGDDDDDSDESGDDSGDDDDDSDSDNDEADVDANLDANLDAIKVSETFDIDETIKVMEFDVENLNTDTADSDSNTIDRNLDNSDSVKVLKIDDLLLDETTTTNVDSIEVLDSDEVDYKKMSVGKLRSIASEKNSGEDYSKMKKTELLKILEVN